jgi:hypothetical protein
MGLMDAFNPAEIARGLLEKAGITPEFVAEQWQRFQATLAAWEADRAGFKMASRQIVATFIARLDAQDAEIAELKALLLSAQNVGAQRYRGSNGTPDADHPAQQRANSHEQHHNGD